MAAKSLTTSEQREPATSISIFQSTRNMLPYYIAAGHHQYAKGTRMSLQLFDAWSQQCPDLMDEVFGKGHHTVRYSSKNMSGTGSDMSIEESVMREAKTSDGIGHGTLCQEDALGSRLPFILIEHISKVSEDYAGLIRRQTDSSSYKHPDTAFATKTRKSLAVETIIDFLEENNPFDSQIDKCDLISLGTGLTDRTGESNSETAKKFGEEFYQILMGYPSRRLIFAKGY